VPTLTGFELTLVRQDAAAAPPADQQPAAMQAGQPSVAGLINRDDFEETLYFLEPAELAYLSAEVEREMRRDVKTEVLNALLIVWSRGCRRRERKSCHSAADPARLHRRGRSAFGDVS
jgi:hypothetical protein